MKFYRYGLFRRFSRTKIYSYFWLLVILFIIYTEIFSYYFNMGNWNELRCKTEQGCAKILLVADPQIIGYNKEVIHFLTPINIYDSDRRPVMMASCILLRDGATYTFLFQNHILVTYFTILNFQNIS
ncbi:hypothetical protein NQ317_010325 [Molorchus minor]|uniref:Uncharacterized protein n=1 Tax=Molorchus minor TaxID=1323400 RepID=A0ABQ9J3J0_9CUCU|nr:hypothetical protein NQ317_010325 [Molorchus minor]